ncbi:MAG: hypothetical protein N3F66_07975 [Spirochaetes bacterium]|nr:hypothetical protein [Spirochaetota bacterium]
MVDNRNSIETEERLIFTQTWFDFWFVVLLFCGLLLLILWNKIKTVEHFAIFIYCLLQIFVPVYLFFKLAGIRVFEITPDYIQITIGSEHKVVRIPKESIQIIEIQYIPALNIFNRYKSEKIVFHFRYVKGFNAQLKGLKNFFYGKKISVTHNSLFLDKTSKVVAFIEKYYHDRLSIDHRVKEYLEKKYGNDIT